MMTPAKRELLASPRLDSRIHSSNVTNSERWIGFFLGPAGVILLNAILASYLNVFYTDVIKVGGLWGGLFLMIFPIASKIMHQSCFQSSRPRARSRRSVISCFTVSTTR